MMAVITSMSSKQQTVLEPCYISPPLSPLSAYGFASSTSSSFSAASSQFFTRSSPSTRLPSNSIYTSSSSSSVRFEIPRLTTPSRSMTAKKPLTDNAKNQSNAVKKSETAVTGTKKACLCSPSTHPGSFRCAMHRNSPRGGASQSNSSGKTASSYRSSIRLNYLRSAMNNSLVRIGKGDLVKRDLATPVRPSAQNQRRRVDFQPKPSCLSVMSKTTSELH